MANFLMGDGGEPIDDKEQAMVDARNRQRAYNEAHMKDLANKHWIQNSLIQFLPTTMQNQHWREYGVDEVNKPNWKPRLMFNSPGGLTIPEELVPSDIPAGNILLEQYLRRGLA